MRDPRPMNLPRLLACLAAVAACTACSSSSGSGNANRDGGDTPDGGDPDADADPPPRACTTSANCPTDSPCCMRDGDGGAHCAVDPQTPQVCLCEKGSECASGACSLAVDTSGTPTGPYVCVPNDGNPYHGCMGTASCWVPYCCVTDTHGNRFCGLPCTDPSTCGSAHCDPFDYSSSVNCNGGMNACGL